MAAHGPPVRVEPGGPPGEPRVRRHRRPHRRGGAPPARRARSTGDSSMIPSVRGAGRHANGDQQPDAADHDGAVQQTDRRCSRAKRSCDDGPVVAGPVDLGDQRVAAVEHDQDAAQEHAGLDAHHDPPVLGEAERPGDKRRQGDRPADRAPEVIPGEQGANEPAARLRAQHPEDDRRDDEGEEDDASHHRGHRQHVDRVEQAEEMARGHGLVPAGRPWATGGRPEVPGVARRI